jgi:hypothetical protein
MMHGTMNVKFIKRVSPLDWVLRLDLSNVPIKERFSTSTVYLKTQADTASEKL